MTAKKIIGIVCFLLGGAFLGAYHISNKDKDWTVLLLTTGVCLIAHGAVIFCS